MTMLPNSWAIVPIVDVLALNKNGKPFQQGWSPQCENHPASNEKWGVLKTTAIQHGMFWGHENKQLPESLEPRAHIEVHAGDLLMTCAGPRARCGVVCLVEHTRPNLMMSGKMYRFRPNKAAMDAHYLAYFIQSRTAQVAIDGMKTGISDSGLNLTHDRFAALAVPVAPLNEQRRIVAKIEELFSELDRGVESLWAVQRQLIAYKQSLLDKHFASVGGSKPLPSLLKVPMSNGYSGKPVKSETAFKVLSLSATTSGTFDSQHFKFLDEAGLERRDIWCEPDDVLVQRGNTAEYVGVPAIYTGEANEFIFPDLMIRLRANRSQILPKYLYYALSSPRIRNYLRAKAKGSAGTMPKISQAILSSVQIPYSILQEQNSIVQKLDEEFSSIAALAQTLEQQALKASALRQAILQRAFSGQLVAQDAGDESASALLERIYAEQEEGSTKKWRNAKNGRKEAA